MAKSAGETSRTAKRKNSSSDKRPTKRARSESGDEEEEDRQTHILRLENEIAESKKKYNNIADLITILKDEEEDPDNSILAAVSLCRTFTRLAIAGDMSKKPKSTEKDTTVLNWLRSRYSEYKAVLLDLLSEDGAGPTALPLLMRLMRNENTFFQPSENYNFPAEFLTEIVQGLVAPESDKQARRDFSRRYVEEHDDVRFYTFQAIE